MHSFPHPCSTPRSLLFHNVFCILVSGSSRRPPPPSSLCPGFHWSRRNGNRSQSLAQLDFRPWPWVQVWRRSPAPDLWHPSRGAASSSSATRLPATGPGLVSVAPRWVRRPRVCVLWFWSPCGHVAIQRVHARPCPRRETSPHEARRPPRWLYWTLLCPYRVQLREHVRDLHLAAERVVPRLAFLIRDGILCECE